MNRSQIQSIYNAPSDEALAEIQRGFILRVYAWMALGLFMTALAALGVVSIPAILFVLIKTPMLYMGLLIAEVVLVMVLGRLINKFSSWVAGMLFVAYAILNGVTIALILLMYTHSSVGVTFGITACTFGIMSVFGYTTRRDLTRLGNILLMALLGMLLASLVNLLIASPAIYWITSYVGVLIFIGLIAYDTQKLKRMSAELGENGEVVQKASILGALSLYLDFINLFLLLLRILGRRK